MAKDPMLDARLRQERFRAQREQDERLARQQHLSRLIREGKVSVECPACSRSSVFPAKACPACGHAPMPVLDVGTASTKNAPHASDLVPLCCPACGFTSPGDALCCTRCGNGFQNHDRLTYRVPKRERPAVQASVPAPNPKPVAPHLAWRSDRPLVVHGQQPALATLVAAFKENTGFFSPASKRPLLMILAGPRSCGRRTCADGMVASLHDPFGGTVQVVTDDAIRQPSALVGHLASVRFGGKPGVVILERSSTAPDACEFLADVLLGKHADDWSKVLVLLVIDAPADICGRNVDQQVDVLRQSGVAARLLGLAAILAFRPLDDDARLRILGSVVDGHAREQRLAVTPDDDLFAFVFGKLPPAADAEAVLIVAQRHVFRAIDAAAANGWTKVRLVVKDGIVVPLAAK